MSKAINNKTTLNKSLATYTSDSGGVVTGMSGVSGSMNGLAVSLGFVPGVDNTAAFAAYRNYLNNTVRTAQMPLYLGIGKFYADSIVLAANGDSAGHEVPTIRIYGAGPYQTQIIANTSSNEVFISMAVGIIHDMQFHDLAVIGAGTANPNQIGILLQGRYDSYYASGGVLNGLTWRNSQVYGFDGEQFVSKGGSVSTLTPNQGIEFAGTTTSFVRSSGNHYPCLSLIGQHGQVKNNGLLAASGTNRLNNGGENVYVGCDPEYDSPVPASVASNVLSIAFARHRTARPYRAVTTASGVLPAELTKGVTYYSIRVSDYKVALTTTRALAGSGTGSPITISTVGTLPWQLVPMWATNVDTTTGIITLGNRTFLTDGDGIMFLGLNAPAGVTLGTVYFWKPVVGTLRQGYLYDTSAHALVGGATGKIIPTTTGTYTDFGMRAAGADGTNIGNPINVDLGYLSSASAEVALAMSGNSVNNGSNVHVKPYFEQVQNGVKVSGGYTASIDGGELANSGWGSGGPGEKASVFAVESTQSARIVVANSPRIQGTTDTISKQGGGCYIDFVTPVLYNNYTTGNGITSMVASTSAPQVGQSGGEVAINAWTWMILNSDTTAVTSIKSWHLPGAMVKFRIWPGTGNHIDFSTGGNLQLGGATTVRCRTGQTVTFAISQAYFNTWELLSISGDWNKHPQSITFANASTAIDVDSGLEVTIGTLTGPITLASPTNGSLGDMLTMHFLQDATGGRVVTMPAIFKGAALSSGGAGLKLQAKYQFDGTNWMMIGTSGWV